MVRNLPCPNVTSTVVSSFHMQDAPFPADAVVSLSNNSATSHVEPKQVTPRHHKPVDNQWRSGMARTVLLKHACLVTFVWSRRRPSHSAMRTREPSPGSLGHQTYGTTTFLGFSWSRTKSRVTGDIHGTHVRVTCCCEERNYLFPVCTFVLVVGKHCTGNL